MAKELEKLLSGAKLAYSRGDKHTGARWIDRLLRENYAYLPTWEFLYGMYGKGQNFEDFQRSFTEKYYPTQLRRLKSKANQRVVQAFAQPWASEEVGPPLKPGLTQKVNRWFKPGKRSETKAEPAGVPSESKAQPAGDLAAPHPAFAVPLAQTTFTPQPGQTGVFPAPITSDFAPVGSPSGNGAPVSVLVVDDIAQTRDNIIRSLQFHTDIQVVGAASTGLEGVQLTKRLRPDVVLMDVNMPDMDGIAATEMIRREQPATQIVILTVQDDVDYMRNAMRVGARDFLAKPPDIDELVTTVVRAGGIAKKEKAKSPAVEMPSPGKSLANQGKIISVYSPKGGVGCTTIAANLAAILHNEEAHVLVVDGNLQFGDVVLMFNEQGKNTILDLASRPDELDNDVVNEVLVTHESGIKLLAPPRPEQGEHVTGEQFSAVLGFLRDLFPYQIVDLPHRLTEHAIAALDMSDLVILLVSQEIPALASIRRFYDLAAVMKMNTKRFLLVMNQYDERLNLTPEKVSQNLRQEISLVIPAANEIVIPSINRGVPFMLRQENLGKPLGKAMLSLAGGVRQRLTELEQERVAGIAASRRN